MKKILTGAALVTMVALSAATFAYPGGEKGDRMTGEHYEEVRAAIEANDYNLLPTEVQEKMTQEQFADKVEKKADMEEHKAAIEAAVAANDFATFQALHAEKKADMEAKKEEMKEEREAKRQERLDAGEEVREPKGERTERAGKAELTEEEKEEKLEERFNEMVTYYEENGELPKMKEGAKSKKGMKGMKGKKGKRKHFGENHRGLVKSAVKNVDTDRLEKALSRIDARIAAIESNDALDTEAQEKALDMLGGIKEVIEEILA